MNVVAVVPARNEARRVAATVSALRGIESVGEVIVVDDGSTDATAELAKRAGARVLRLGRSRGKGNALAHGIANAGPAEVYLLVDADLGDSARALRALLEPVLAGEIDVAIAAPPRGDGPSGFGLVEDFARWGVRRLAGSVMDRPLSGQRAIRREVVEAVGGFADGFGVDAAFTVDALRAGYRVIEVPCEFTHAKTGRDPAGFVHRARQGLDVARALGSRWRR
ncbi:MAG: glycosyltransferase family 2 protein [Actinomycetota bacterium]